MAIKRPKNSHNYKIGQNCDEKTKNLQKYKVLRQCYY